MPSPTPTTSRKPRPMRRRPKHTIGAITIADTPTARLRIAGGRQVHYLEWLQMEAARWRAKGAAVAIRHTPEGLVLLAHTPKAAS